MVVVSRFSATGNMFAYQFVPFIRELNLFSFLFILFVPFLLPVSVNRKSRMRWKTTRKDRKMLLNTKYISVWIRNKKKYIFLCVSIKYVVYTFWCNATTLNISKLCIEINRPTEKLMSHCDHNIKKLI